MPDCAAEQALVLQRSFESLTFRQKMGTSFTAILQKEAMKHPNPDFSLALNFYKVSGHKLFSWLQLHAVAIERLDTPIRELPVLDLKRPELFKTQGVH